MAFFLTLMETPALFEDIMSHLLRQARQWTQGFVARRLAGLVRRFQAAGSPSAPMADTLRRLLAILEAPGMRRMASAHAASPGIRVQPMAAAPVQAPQGSRESGSHRPAPRARFPQRLLRRMLLARLAALPHDVEQPGNPPSQDAALSRPDVAGIATMLAPSGPRVETAGGQTPVSAVPVRTGHTAGLAERVSAMAGEALLTWAQWVLDDWYDGAQTPWCLRFETVQAAGLLPPLAPWPTRPVLNEPMTRAP